MIYCIWYPSGGFGHFVNGILTLHGKNFVRPNKVLEFSETGNSHNLDLVVPKYFHETWQGYSTFLNDKHYCVLIDNGINNEGNQFKDTFPTAKVIKICYNDYTWPVVARTMIEKAMGRTIENALNLNEWGSNEPWALREKYFLFLRDNTLRYAWRSTTDSKIDIDTLFRYDKMFNVLNSIVDLETFEETWKVWRLANNQYIEPVETASTIIFHIQNKNLYDVSHITDVWTQAVVYYYIWLTFEIEVPHNDYSNWFTNTSDIVTMLNNLRSYH